MTTTTRPATAAEIAAAKDRAVPAHRLPVTVEANTDGRATVGKAKTIHRATVTRYLNAYDESCGSASVHVDCGALRYRNTGGKGNTMTAVSSRYDVDCDRCLAGE